MIIRKKIDKASVRIQEEMLRNTVFPDVNIEVEKTLPDGTKVIYYTYLLKNARIVNYTIGDVRRKAEMLQPLDQPVETAVPIEEIQLVYEEMEVNYQEYDNDVPIGGWIGYVWNFIQEMMG